MNKANYIEILNSSKFTLKEKKWFFVGILSTTILDKNLFESNSKINEYVKLFEDIFEISPYKDYLYRSRTLLNSRVIRDFLELEDTISIKKCFDMHINFIYSKKEGSSAVDIQKINVVKSEDSNLLEDMISRKNGLNE